MKRPRTTYVQSKKAALFAAAVNILEILAALGLTVIVLMSKSGAMARTAVVFLSLIVILGAVVDIREAVSAIRVHADVNSLDETVQAMTLQNRQLRVQRHDFLNHLQVVYSLMEMREYDEAMDYITQVYGDIRSVGKNLKTASAPVNALLMAKTQECRERGIHMDVDVRARWEDLPVADWEICRCLGNLIDNARDALKDTRHPKIRVTLTEDVRSFGFSVRNNGPRIDKEVMESIFEAGFSLKGEGRGMGLYITRQTLREAGGDITVTSDDRFTEFTGSLPRAEAKAADAEKDARGRTGA